MTTYGGFEGGGPLSPNALRPLQYGTDIAEVVEDMATTLAAYIVSRGVYVQAIGSWESWPKGYRGKVEMACTCWMQVDTGRI